MLKRIVRGSQPQQQYTPMRLPFGSVHTAIRCPAAGIRSSALDQPATEAEAAPAEPDWNSYAERLPPLPAGLHKTSTAAPPVDGAATGFQTIAAAAAADATARKKVRPIVKVSKSGNTSAVAGYIISVLDDAADGTALVRAVGAAATEVALKALTRASERVKQEDSSTTLAFRPQSKRIHSERIDVSTVFATDFWVTRVPSAEVPGGIPDGLRPLFMKDTTDPAAVEQHIMYAARHHGQTKQLGPLAYLILNGPNTSKKFSAALKGIISCRLNLTDARKADLTVTISRSTVDRLRRPDNQQQQLPVEVAETAVDQSPDEADSSSIISEGADESSTGRSTWAQYFIQVHVCKPRDGARPLRATARSGRDQYSSSGSSWMGRQHSRRAEDSDQISAETAAAAEEEQEEAKPSPVKSSRKTPGMIEVPEDEWNQLKEQLEVVPHLTEQLQVMTRQHEQLLSLLAGQQQEKRQ